MKQAKLSDVPPEYRKNRNRNFIRELIDLIIAMSLTFVVILVLILMLIKL
jgi:hypothetical protein